MTFKSGMKLTVTDTDGLSKTLTNSSSNTVNRSSLLTFPVITYKQDGVLEFPEGALTSYDIPMEGGTVEIPVMTNQEYEVVIPENSKDWITFLQTKALREDVITLNVLANTMPEARSADVLVNVAGETLRVITISQEAYIRIPQEGDYIDEYGVNHGQGITVGETIWAPVNCGYHNECFKYGKLYQWGRKYGQGYVDPETWNEYEDPSSGESVIVVGPVSLSVGQAESNSNKFYTDQDESPYDWLVFRADDLWNAGTEDNPIKTEYDPCPSGWRVPTEKELDALAGHYSSWAKNEAGQAGRWYSGSNEYSAAVPRVFLPAAGLINKNGSAHNRGLYSYYWSSRNYDNTYCCCLVFSSIAVNTDWKNETSNGMSVRCVLE